MPEHDDVIIGIQTCDVTVEDEAVKSQKVTSIPISPAQIDAMRYLHEHAYKRILWYRAEIWRISMPLWMGLGAITISTWSAARISHGQRLLLMAVIIVIGGVLIECYRRYLNPLFEATKYCNDVVQRREIALCAVIGGSIAGYTVDGSINSDHLNMKIEVCEEAGGDAVACQKPDCLGDCDYGIWRRTKPSLVNILVGISVVILFSAVVAILTVDLNKEQKEGSMATKMGQEAGLLTVPIISSAVKTRP